MNIKVSGVTDLEQLVQLDKMGIDYVGLNFEVDVSGLVVKGIVPEGLNQLSTDIKKVGLFSNVSIDDVFFMTDTFKLDAVQFCGEETPEYCAVFSANTEVIKTLYFDDGLSSKLNESLAAFDEVCDYYCFDLRNTMNNEKESVSMYWQTIMNAAFEKPFFLGGGLIRPIDASQIHTFRHPDFFGVDLNEYFEKKPGTKDTALILSFMRAIAQVDN